MKKPIPATDIPSNGIPTDVAFARDLLRAREEAEKGKIVTEEFLSLAANKITATLMLDSGKENVFDAEVKHKGQNIEISINTSGTIVDDIKYRADEAGFQTSPGSLMKIIIAAENGKEALDNINKLLNPDVRPMPAYLIDPHREVIGR